MKQDDRELLAAEYVLGTLDTRLRARVRARFATDPALCRHVAAWEERLSGLGVEDAPVEPAADLWDRIDAALDTEPRDAPDTASVDMPVTVRADEGRWEELVPGVHKKPLFIDHRAGYEAFLLRFDPGARLPAHPHDATEECLMLEGEAWIGGLSLKAGDYHLIPGGTGHPESRSENGAVIYVRGEIRAAG